MRIEIFSFHHSESCVGQVLILSHAGSTITGDDFALQSVNGPAGVGSTACPGIRRPAGALAPARFPADMDRTRIPDRPLRRAARTPALAPPGKSRHGPDSCARLLPILSRS